jgi:hypothetical protein
MKFKIYFVLFLNVYIRALLVGVNIISEDACLEVAVSNVNANWLALGDSSCTGGQKDQAVDQVVFIECLVLDNFQHLL